MLNLGTLKNTLNYTCKVAKTPSEVQQLIEAGFEYVCTKDDFLFFRKRK